MYKVYHRWLALFLLVILNGFSYASPPYFKIGTGIYDITGPAAEIGMMGYAQIEQLTSGIHTRLWSRAYIIQDSVSQKKVVFVSADLGMIFQSIKSGVIKELNKHFANTYTVENVMLSATHTHSGPGGYAHRALYNITSRGFDKQNYQTIVHGIVQSIIRAHNNLEPGYITISAGELTNTTKNRSVAAYIKNPEQERSTQRYSTDKSVVQINLFNQRHQAVGLINWHAVHGVSMGNKNTLISGDNKGFASYLFEKEMHANYLANKTFVAAFAQSNEGDASPNIFTDDNTGKCLKFTCPDIKHTQLIGKRQFDKAKELFTSPITSLTTGVDSRFKFINMADQHINHVFSFNASTEYHTTSASLGYSFGAGTSDGLGLTSLFSQGQLKSNGFVNLIRNTIASPTKALIMLQSPKPILLAVGLNKPNWVSHNLPIQLFHLGQLLIVGVPAEFTTMAGARLKKQLLTEFDGLVKYVVIAGLANDYSGYVTTFEEYQQQNYEGGFTLFGPWTLAAYQQNFSDLARDMLEQKPTQPGSEPEDMQYHTFSLISPVLFDDKPPGTSFGSVHTQPKENYKKNELVHTSFWAGHPRNNFQTMKGFLEVQFFNQDHWQTLYYDWDPSTIYRWQRKEVSYSLGHVYWKIPQEARLGKYRIVHHGHYKYGWNQEIYEYIGKSRIFSIS